VAADQDRWLADGLRELVALVDGPQGWSYPALSEVLSEVRGVAGELGIDEGRDIGHEAGHEAGLEDGIEIGRRELQDEQDTRWELFREAGREYARKRP
jgi:hypothetical protein